MAIEELSLDVERQAFEAAHVDEPRPTSERHPIGAGTYGGYVEGATETAFCGWMMCRRAQLDQQASAQGVTDEHREKNFENFQKLTRALEVIAVGDAKDPVQGAIDVLVDIGFWERASAKEAPAVVDGVSNQLSGNSGELPPPDLMTHLGRECYSVELVKQIVSQECARKAGAGQAVGDDYITVQKLQEALSFWLPSIPTRMGAEDIAARIEHDSWLLVGAAGDVKPGAEDAGWISLNPVAVAQEPVAHLRYRCGQQWSGNGNHDIQHGEWLEVCEPGEKSDGGAPAFPVFATPPAAQAGDARDAARLDWLDAVNKRLKMGFQIRTAPAGNISVTSVVHPGKEPPTIREAIDAAISAAKGMG